jgi:hypothetical protein
MVLGQLTSKAALTVIGCRRVGKYAEDYAADDSETECQCEGER